MTTAENKARKSVYGAGAINKTSKTKRARKVKQRIERAAKRGSKNHENTFSDAINILDNSSASTGITHVDTSFVTNNMLQAPLDTHAPNCGLFKDEDPRKFGCTCGLYFNVRNKP